MEDRIRNDYGALKKEIEELKSEIKKSGWKPRINVVKLLEFMDKTNILDIKEAYKELFKNELVN